MLHSCLCAHAFVLLILWLINIAVFCYIQVKLAHQEFELASVLKKLTLGTAELAVIRDRAEKLRDGKLKMRGDALLPITLASFIFDSLCVGQGLL